MANIDVKIYSPLTTIISYAVEVPVETDPIVPGAVHTYAKRQT